MMPQWLMCVSSDLEGGKCIMAFITKKISTTQLVPPPPHLRKEVHTQDKQAVFKNGNVPCPKIKPKANSTTAPSCGLHIE